MSPRIRLGNGLKIERRRFPAPTLGEVEAEALAGLLAASGALTSAGIVHWLTYGALLGLVRDGRLIPHDGDLDIAIAERPEARRVVAALAGAGFRLGHETRIGGRISNQKFHRGPVQLDLFYLDREGDMQVDRTAFDRHSLCVATHPAMPTTPLPVAAGTVPAPADREAYLAHLYGPDWRIPVADWDWRLSPPNMTVALHWRSAGFLAIKLLRRRLRRRRGAP